MTNYWIATVSREHVLTGVQGEFCQVCHGKQGPLARMKKGDWLIYYSPKLTMQGKVACQKFTAIGQIADDNIYKFEMSTDFIPFRRNVTYLNNAKEQPIHPLLQKLSFTAGKSSWGMVFCQGIFKIKKADFELIKKGMEVAETASSKKRKLEETSTEEKRVAVLKV